jgi:hypothetical protein
LGEVHDNVRKDKLNADIRLVTPTFQAIVDALCALNGWSEHEIILGEKSKQLNKDQAERDVQLKNAGAVFTNQYFIREYGLQEGDLAEPLPSQTPQPQFKAIPSKPFSFAASVNGLTQEQQELDELADQNFKLLSDNDLKDLILSSESKGNLAIVCGTTCATGNHSIITYGGRIKRVGIVAPNRELQACDCCNGQICLIPSF